MDTFASSAVFVFDKYRLDRRGGGLIREGDEGGLVQVALGSRALDILTLLVERCGELVSKEQIFAAVWRQTAIEDSNLTVQIANLRRVLDQGRSRGSCIQTVSGHGYRFIVPVMRQPSDVRSSSIATPETDARLQPRLSLVVLPFANLSPDPEEEYFVDAITDDLTADLSRIADSFVIARTTAFFYKGKSVDVRQVARELGVRYVLEGSARPLGDRVQINVQLIDGETGSHVWADRFDIDRRNSVKAQSEIVGRLVTTLTAELIRDIARCIEQEHAADSDARDVALRAHALRVQTLAADVQTRHAMVDLLERALVRDPESIDARIQIAAILVSDVADAYSTSVDQDKARAEQLISEALERDPNRSEARRVMGQLRRVQGRWAESQVELERAITLDPNNSVAIRQLGITLRSLGKPEEAIPVF